MKTHSHRIISLILCGAMMFGLCACGGDENNDVSQSVSVGGSSASGEPTELRVVIEGGISTDEITTEIHEQASQLGSIARTYSKLNKDVSVNLEKIPADESERSAYLQRLRVEIMSGDGPDVYLLPSVAMSADPMNGFYMEPLFSHLKQSMQNRIFLDIAEHFDNDESLDKGALNTAVMDGVMSGGARYVLPLQYTVPVLLMHSQTVNDSGIDTEPLSRDINTCFKTVAEFADPKLTFSRSQTIFQTLPEIYNYADESVNLDESNFAELIGNYRDFLTLSSQAEHGFWSDMLYDYWSTGTYPINENEPIAAVNLGNDVLNSAAYSKVSGDEITALPLNNSDGTLTATVTYWGAVDASTEHPTEAYEFLAYFLTPEVQFNSNLFNFDTGWPVLIEGSAETIWADSVSTKDYGSLGLEHAFTELALKSDDLPILQAEIGSIIFNSPRYFDLDSEISAMILNNTDGEAQMAQEIIALLKRDLQE